jgi:hypothetical protein
MWEHRGRRLSFFPNFFHIILCIARSTSCGIPRTMALRLCLPMLFALGATPAHAGLDHELPLDQGGIGARNYQTGLEYGVVAVEVAGCATAQVRRPPISPRVAASSSPRPPD